MSADGVIDAPTWTFEYGFPDKQAEAITAFAQGCQGILLGRTTFEMFSTAWPQRTVEEDPGAPFFNDTTKYVVSGSLTDASIWQNSEIVGAYDPGAIRKLKDEVGRPLHERQRHARPSDAGGRPDRRPPPVRVPADPG